MNIATTHDAWRIGGYEVLEPIGATAYRATDGTREVALAICDRALDARIANVNHPAVARIVEAGPFDDRYLIATEWIHGTPLDATPRPWLQLRRIVTTIASGLGALHEAGVVHGALETSNVIIADGRPIIVGVGGDPSAAYMAPEQLRGEPLGSRSDFYALGVILYELLCGEPPFANHQHEPVIAPRKRTPERDIPKVAEDLCMWLLAKDRTTRLPNARVFAVTIAATEVSP